LKIVGVYQLYRYEAVYGPRPSWADLDQNDSSKRRYEDGKKKCFCRFL